MTVLIIIYLISALLNALSILVISNLEETNKKYFYCLLYPIFIPIFNTIFCIIFIGYLTKFAMIIIYHSLFEIGFKLKMLIR